MDRYIEEGKSIIRKLKSLGYKAFFVGGFVRDHILRIDANDIDITTDALPNEIESIFENTKPTGKRYGTISVFINKYQFEVTTFRADIKYIDFRHPERVVFSKRLEDDLKRRDFTINAFAMDEDEEIIDIFFGRKDLENKLIKAIGDPETRFREDALRMLRAFRFVSKLGFDIESDTLFSIEKNISLLKEISNERVIGEFKEIFRYKNYHKAIYLLGKVKIEKAFPELMDGILYLGEKTEYEIDWLEFFALAFSLAETDVPGYWRFSNKELEKIRTLKALLVETKKATLGKMSIYKYGKELAISANKLAVILNRDVNRKKEIEEINNSLPIHNLKDMDFGGEEVLKLVEGKNPAIVGEVLAKAEKAILLGKLRNEHGVIREYIIKVLERNNEE